MRVRRGDIFWIDAHFDTVGCEAESNRPWLVISNNDGNRNSPTVIVAGISCANPRPNFPCHVPVGHECGVSIGRVMLEQIRTVDKSRLGRFVGTATPETMDKVDAALKVSVGLMFGGRECC